MKTFALQGDTLDAICVRYYGRTEGVVETVLAANPGLAELGAVLPHRHRRRTARRSDRARG